MKNAGMNAGDAVPKKAPPSANELLGRGNTPTELNKDLKPSLPEQSALQINRDASGLTPHLSPPEEAGVWSLAGQCLHLGGGQELEEFGV